MALLPDHVLRGAHDRSALAAAGVSRHALTTADWRRLDRGRWVSSFSDDTDPRERIRRAATLVRDGGAIGGWAAAVMHGAYGLDGRNPDGTLRPVLLCLPRPARCRRRADVSIFRSTLEDGEVQVVDDVPVTSPVRTCVDLARLEGHLGSAVVAVDAVRAACLSDLDAASGWLCTHRRWRGVTRAKTVLALSRPAVKSPQETRLRLVWTLDAGLPEPVVNARVLHREGELLCEADLLEAGSGLVGEYDGAHHATAGQRSVDHGSARRDATRGADCGGGHVPGLGAREIPDHPPAPRGLPHGSASRPRGHHVVRRLTSGRARR